MMYGYPWWTSFSPTVKSSILSLIIEGVSHYGSFGPQIRQDLQGKFGLNDTQINVLEMLHLNSSQRLTASRIKKQKSSDKGWWYALDAREQENIATLANQGMLRYASGKFGINDEVQVQLKGLFGLNSSQIQCLAHILGMKMSSNQSTASTSSFVSGGYPIHFFDIARYHCSQSNTARRT
eukprot:TRINITY_DN2537_c0_g1_i1.p1 TRINITY_DN2537_c0_g1~~TRINITY_DN2537_c0_g1_i1.p1  ORF type:complete len:180 (-),score=3.96 TRINITY_DN2537_c0_g1_i1:118-657(-)